MSLPGTITMFAVAGAFGALAALSALVATRFHWRWLVHVILLGLPLAMLVLITFEVGELTDRFLLDNGPYVGVRTTMLLSILLATVVLLLGTIGAIEPRAKRWRPGVVLAALIVLLAIAAGGFTWLDRQRLELISASCARSSERWGSINMECDPDTDAEPLYQAAAERLYARHEFAALQRIYGELVEVRRFDADPGRATHEQLSGVIEQVLAATSRPHWGLDSSPSTIPPADRPTLRFVAARDFAHVLILEARVAALEGDADRAQRALHSMVRLASHVGQTPSLQSAMVAESIRKLARTTFLTLGASLELDPTCLESGIGPSRREEMKRAFLVDHAKCIKMLCGAAMDETSVMIGRLQELIPIGPAPLTRWAYRMIALPTDVADTERCCDEYHNAIDRPGASLRPLPLPPRGMLSHVVMPRLDGGLLSVDHAEALDRIPPIAAAVRRFERAHGRWPTSIDELVPTYLDAVPDDPLSPRPTPMRIAVVNGNLAIYRSTSDSGDDGDIARDTGTPLSPDLGYVIKPAVRPTGPPGE